MSIEAMSWVFQQDIKPSSLKFVLVAMADCCREDRLCWPSIARLEKITSQNRKTIIQAIDSLQDLGFLRDTGKKTGRTGQIKIYEFNLSNSTKSGIVTIQEEIDDETVPETVSLETTQKETVPFLPPNSTVFTRKESQKRDSEPSLKPFTKPASKSEKIKAGGKGDFCETWDDEILPWEWQDFAEKLFIPEESIFASWRKFKDTTGSPFQFKRWKAWVSRERNI